MAKCEKSLTITVKRSSASGATKDAAELALAAKIVRAVENKKNFTCDGDCDSGQCEAVVYFKGDLDFHPSKIHNKPQPGYTMGWKCSFKGKVEIACECPGGDPEIETGR